MEKLGFFGGSFNPVTNAHIELIKDVIEKENLDKVYFVPMGDLYQKDNLIKLKYRIDMLKLTFENENKMEILDISNKDKKTSAIDTFKTIDELFPNAQRFFIMGSDNHKNIKNWKNSNELIHNYNYIILDRNNGNTKDISSTLVREKIKNGEDISSVVPEQIIKYIKENNLYR